MGQGPVHAIKRIEFTHPVYKTEETTTLYEVTSLEAAKYFVRTEGRIILTKKGLPWYYAGDPELLDVLASFGYEKAKAD
ncbi:hypothetical protein QUF79_07595 [Fictibacillus enclensis]|uniref:hypothetical protein n=1 Tax=Fictibacillus enclensis TaxID=1017270 RepID=UPI0025A0BBE5|nr:hypothetical protein [Fictibacillus enclensis]MDM5197877.1 hypothetical protein [Fictibacillus enclensis]